jgi:hypothetical protein
MTLSRRHLAAHRTSHFAPLCRTVSATVLLTAAIGLMTSPAYATLGGDVGSIATDVATMNASAQAPVPAVAHSAASASTSSGTSTSAVTLHTLTLPTGTVVHEYVSSSGVVFALAWQGPVLPPLKQLLGTIQFTQYTQAVSAAQTSGYMHGRSHVVLNDLVVMSGGHMGAFFGVAYLRSAMPAGFSANDIQ